MSSRRQFLAGSVAVTVALAGCLGSDDGDDDDHSDESDAHGDNGDDSNGNGTGWGGDEPTDWVSAEFADEEWIHSVVRLSTLTGYERFTGDDEFMELGDILGVSLDEVDLLVTAETDARYTTTFVGAFDPDAVTETLGGDERLSEEGSYEGYDIYDVGDAGEHSPADFEGDYLAVGENSVVIASGREFLEATTDTAHGDRSSLTETDDTSETLNEALAVDDIVFQQTEDTPGDSAVAVGYDVDATESTVSEVVLTEDSDDATAFNEAVESATWFDEVGIEDIEVNRDESMVTLTGVHPTDQFGTDGPPNELETVVVLLQWVVDRLHETTGETPPTAPQVAFDFSYDENAEELVVTHTAGDQFTAGNVTVEGEGFDGVGSTWADLGDVEADASVLAGDRIELVNVESTFSLDIVWQEEDRSAIIASRQGPD